MKQLLIGLSFLLNISTMAQAPATNLPQLTVEKIMQDPKVWIGTSPSGIFWAEDSKTIYFNWNPVQAKSDSLYKISLTNNSNPVKVSPSERHSLPPATGGIYNRARTLKLYEKDGDLFLLDCKPQKTGGKMLRQLTNTVERETNPAFNGDEQKVVFIRTNNLFAVSLITGELTQITHFDPGKKSRKPKPMSRNPGLNATSWRYLRY